MGETLEQFIDVLKAKAEALADALNLESQLEDERALIKPEAIKRVMARDSLAATPAEKIIETDAEYWAHRAKQRASIVARFRADAEYKAAAARLTNASLLTPDMIYLEEENKRQSNAIAMISHDLSMSEAKVDELTVETDRLRGIALDASRRAELLTETEKQLRTQRDTLARDLEIAHAQLDRSEGAPVL